MSGVSALWRSDGSISSLAARQVLTLDVGMDLDGVCHWFHTAYFEGCKKAGLVAREAVRMPALTWEFYEAYDHNLATFIRNCDQLADLGLLWAGEPIAGSMTAWDTIVDAGHRVHVITDRSFGSHPAVSEVATRLWLTQHHRVFHSLTFTTDKTAVATDLMLEDKLANYDALDAAGTEVYLINRSWNAAPGDERRRVTTHDEFVFAVLRRGAGSHRG